MRTAYLLLLCLVVLLPACATDKDAGAVSDRQEPTTGSRITKRDRESDVRVMSREELERARNAGGGAGPIPKN